MPPVRETGPNVQIDIVRPVVLIPLMVAGYGLFGLAMAGWTLPLTLLQAVTAPNQIAWRTALYRVAVDGGMCLGPLLSGVLTARHAGVVPGVMAAVLTATGFTLLARRRLSVR